MRVLAPGCQLITVPVNLAVNEERAVAELDCSGESFKPSDLGFLERRSAMQFLGGIDQRADQEALEQLRNDELHVIYAEGRINDDEFRALSK